MGIEVKILEFKMLTSSLLFVANVFLKIYQSMMFLAVIRRMIFFLLSTVNIQCLALF